LLTVTIHTRAPSSVDIEPWRRVPVAIVVDLARDIGQIDPAIRPLRPPGQQTALFGRAVTALCEPPDFGAVLHALDHVGKGDVLVISAAGMPEFAMIGEILCGHLQRIGAAGVICDGAVRDVGAIAGLPDFSVFTRHITPRGPSSAERGAVNLPVVFGGTIVAPGDLIIGDDDGLVALSPENVRMRLAAAEAKMRKEVEWIAGLEAGKAVGELFGLGAANRV
jgi:4-hydroxy-4-methyl-2-oxoglutarate aldolase